MNKFPSLLFFLSVLSSITFAQNPRMIKQAVTVDQQASSIQDSVKKTRIVQTKAENKNIEEDGISLLCEAYWDKKTNSGYRVQIYSGKSRWEANKVRSEFINQYKQELNAALVYQAPNFKLRVGNFRNKMEASAWLKELKEKFPSAFIVKDEIEIPAYLNK